MPNSGSAGSNESPDQSGRVWVMGVGSPTEAAGNGLHYKNCYVFINEPRIATAEEMESLHHCSKCGPDDAAPRAHFCPVCHMQLLPSGVCPEGH